jgi:3-oxoacyl-(acyl-carrier-protein) synthase
MSAAARLIEHGIVDVAIAGGVDTCARLRFPASFRSIR